MTKTVPIADSILLAAEKAGHEIDRVAIPRPGDAVLLGSGVEIWHEHSGNDPKVILKAKTATSPEHMTPWSGGENPVAPGYRVIVQYRNGQTASPQNADRLRWQHTGHGGDIMAYALCTTAYRPYRQRELEQKVGCVFRHVASGEVRLLLRVPCALETPTAVFASGFVTNAELLETHVALDVNHRESVCGVSCW